TEPFRRAVGEWIRFWADHARAKGIDPRLIGVLVFDEPHTPEHQALIIHWAEAMRAADTGIRVWEDPTFRSAAEANHDLLDVCDVLCPNRGIFLDAQPDYRELFAPRPGRTLEFYSCNGPVRLLDPYSYHRLQAWDCRRY